MSHRSTSLVSADNAPTKKSRHYDIHWAARAGDLERVKYWIEEKQIDVNIRDWDATPLYYACLCGHRDVVQYLLENGAQCREETFDGDRCHYAALTFDIRSLLQEFAARPPVLEAYWKQLRSLLDPPHCFSDMEFVVEGEAMPVHRCILAVRVPCFKEQLETRWFGKFSIPLRADIPFDVFRAFLDFVYGEGLELPWDSVPLLRQIAAKFKVFDLLQLIDTQLELQNYHRSLRKRLPTKLVITPPASPGLCTKLQTDWMLAARKTYSRLDSRADYADIEINVQGTRFRCHRVLLCQRSAYFAALLLGNFKEAQSAKEPSADDQRDDALPVVDLPLVTPSVFAAVIEFIYSDQVENLHLLGPTIVETIDAANQFLLFDLTNLCVSCILPCVDSSTVFDWLTVAFLYSLPKLQAKCCEVIAWDWDDIRNSDTLVSALRGLFNADGPLRDKDEEERLAAYDIAMADVRDALLQKVQMTQLFDDEQRDEYMSEFDDITLQLRTVCL